MAAAREARALRARGEAGAGQPAGAGARPAASLAPSARRGARRACAWLVAHGHAPAASPPGPRLRAGALSAGCAAPRACPGAPERSAEPPPRSGAAGRHALGLGRRRGPPLATARAPRGHRGPAGAQEATAAWPAHGVPQRHRGQQRGAARLPQGTLGWGLGLTGHHPALLSRPPSHLGKVGIGPDTPLPTPISALPPARRGSGLGREEESKQDSLNPLKPCCHEA